MFVSLSARALACALGLVIGFSSVLSAAEKVESPEPVVVELFAGIDGGTIEATVIPRDAKKVTLQLKNKTDQPLAIRLPEAFAAVPVQAQFAGGGGGLFGGGGGGGFGQGGGNQAGNQGGGTQGLGVGGGGQNGAGNAGRGGRNRGGAPGLFNVPAGKVVKVKLTSVCLEYGKPEPHAHNEYAVKPIESLCDKPEVVSILRSLGNGDVSQEVAQLAAWNVANGTSFQQLASQTSKLGLHLPVYSETSISAAAELVTSLKAKSSADTSNTTASDSSSTSGGN